MTCGISPDAAPTTATSQAIASTRTRPNCSFQLRRVREGSTSTSTERKKSGIRVEGSGGRKVSISPSPSRAACARNAASSGPLPSTVARHPPRGNSASASRKRSTPFSSTSRPT